MHLRPTLAPIIALLISLIPPHLPASETNGKLAFSVIITGESSGSLEAMTVDGGSWFTPRKLVHTAALIRHPKGTILWDSGLGTALDEQMDAFSWWEKRLFQVENVQPAITQLASEGLSPNDLFALIPSHMHWDHVSALEDFPGVPIWVTPDEHAESEHGSPPAFIKSQYDDTALIWKHITLQPREYEGFEYSLDIFNDGSLILVDLSGHTHGQLGLFLNHPSGQRYFFIGDTAWTAKGVTSNRGRPAFVDWLVGVDSDYEKNAAQLDKIHQLHRQYPELIIVPAHDELVNRSLAVFPEFY